MVVEVLDAADFPGEMKADIHALEGALNLSWVPEVSLEELYRQG